MRVTWRFHMCDVTPGHVPPRRRCLLPATWLLYKCDMTPVHVWYDSLSVCTTWLLHTCDVTPSYVPPLTICLCVTCRLHKFDINPWFVSWLRHARDMTLSYVWPDSFICVTWLFHMRHTVGGAFYLRHDSFISATWLLYMRDMIPSHITWLFHMCHMTPSLVRYDSFRSTTWFLHMYQPVGVSTMCDTSSLYLWHTSFICVIWPLHTCDTTLSIWHVTLISSTCTFIYVTRLLCMFVKPDSFICATP